MSGKRAGRWGARFMQSRAAVYLYFWCAGMASVYVGMGFFAGPERLGGSVAGLLADLAEFSVLALGGGISALAAAVLMRGAFLRGARTGARGKVYDIVLIGLVAAHAVYGMLAFFVALIGGGSFDVQRAMSAAAAVWFMSLLFGFPTNLLFSVAFTEFFLWRRRASPIRVHP